MSKQGFLPGLYWLPTILQRQYMTYQIFFPKWFATYHHSVSFYIVQCQLLEDTIDVEITMRTLKGIHIIRKDHNSQSSVCSPWGSHMKPFPSLHKKMADYIEEWQNITNPFHHDRTFPNRPNPSPFTNMKSHPKNVKNNGKSHPKKKQKELYFKQQSHFPSPRKSGLKLQLPWQFQL